VSTRKYIVFLSVLFLSLPAAWAEKVDPYVAGVFKVTRVVDGDTIAVDGVSETIRFLCIDTEECEKGPGAERRTAALTRDYFGYVQEKTRLDPMAKFNTPMGWEGKKFAERWFPIGSTVRVEYDSLSRKTGYYGRVLGYVFVKRNGEWVNYNVECVRAGMSPYFDKYGASQRFEGEFIAAEREARAHRRGIWSPYAMAYPNYDERIAWWSRRAAMLKHFEAKYGAQQNAVSVMDEDDWTRLKGLVGKEVLLFGVVDDEVADPSPAILEMQHKNFVRLALVFPEANVFQAVKSRTRSYPGDFVYFRGTLAPGFDRGNRTYVYSVEVNSPEQFFVEIPGKAGSPELPEKEVERSGEEISWEEAPKHMGEEVAVVGRIIRTKNIGRHTFLNFHEDFQSTLTIVVHEESYHEFPEPAEIMYQDRTIRVRGKVSEYQGKPQLVITGPQQVDIVE